MFVRLTPASPSRLTMSEPSSAAPSPPIHEVGPARLGDAAYEVLDSVPVRVEEGDAVPALEVLPDQVLEERRFAGARLPNDVQVRHPVPRMDSEGLDTVPPLRPAEEEKLVF